MENVRYDRTYLNSLEYSYNLMKKCYFNLNRCYEDWIKVIVNPVNVLVIVDIQNDFVEGSLAVKDAGQILEPTNRLIKECPWDKIIYSLDWHPEDHISFFENLHLRELHPDSEVCSFHSCALLRSIKSVKY